MLGSYFTIFRMANRETDLELIPGDSCGTPSLLKGTKLPQWKVYPSDDASTDDDVNVQMHKDNKGY
jgi:hypothetical protein